MKTRATPTSDITPLKIDDNSLKCKILNNFRKFIIMVVFMLLPKRLTYCFTNLSILALIYDRQNKPFTISNINVEKISKLLMLTIDEKLLLFPYYIYKLFWSDKFLEQKVDLPEGVFTVDEIIKNRALFFKHINTMSHLFISNLSGWVKFKLNLRNEMERIRFKHSIERLYMYS
jgi:hypothetical protein